MTYNFLVLTPLTMSCLNVKGCISSLHYVFDFFVFYKSIDLCIQTNHNDFGEDNFNCVFFQNIYK